MAEANGTDPAGDLIDLFSNVLKDLLKAAQPENKTEGDEEKEASEKAANQEPVVCLSEVKKVDFEHFKNRFHEKNEAYAVEALVASASLAHDVNQEQLKRIGTSLPWMRIIESSEDEIVLPGGGWVQRVRINSQAVLGFLAKAAAEVWALDQPRTFLRPFRVLIYFQDKMKEALNELEQKWANTPGSQAAEDNVDHATVGTAQESPEASKTSNDVPMPSPDENFKAEKKTAVPGQQNVDAFMGSYDTLKEMRCYVNFVDKEIMPLVDMFEATAKKEIRFEELWLLFKTGETIYGPPGERVIRRHIDSHFGPYTETEHLFIYQEVWRVYGVATPIDQVKNYSSIVGSKPQQAIDVDGDEDTIDTETFMVDCYYIDYDGSSYRPVSKRFNIRRFEGEKSITSLPCYPIRYAEKGKQLLEELQKKGQKFQEFLETKHVNYFGWTLVNNPAGSRIEVEHGERKMPEYVDGPVVIDFEEAFNSYPRWKPVFREPAVLADNWSLYTDEFPIRRWSGYDRAKLISETTEIVQELDGVSMWQRKQAIEGDEFLIASKLDQKDDQRKKRAFKLRDEDLVFLPKRLFAFALRDRTHVLLDVRFIRHIPLQPHVFERLKVHKTKKEAIRGLVSSHFEKKELEAKMHNSSAGSLGQDFIHGKGDGLVILLHGVPGVGKTATAEAVALERKKPLFPITCGDIGVSRYEVDKNLKRIFRLANKWGCVLLFDEADVFLAQRSTHDIERNALVSVFLRALEYYHGILFLTTNRVGIFDEAFTSRIHLTLHYPDLDEKQTVEIFKTNIQMLRDTDAKRSVVAEMPPLRIDEHRILEFARAQYAMGQQSKANNQANAGWNGRQIRNAFQVASSLAYRRMALEYAKLRETDPGAQPPAPVLNDTHFDTVAQTTRAFNEYLRETKGWSDADLAHLRGYRADYWKDAAAAFPRLSGDRDHRRDQRDYPATDDFGHFRSGPGPGPTQSYGSHSHGLDINSSRPGLESSHADPYMANRRQSHSFAGGGGGGYQTGLFGAAHQQQGSVPYAHAPPAHAQFGLQSPPPPPQPGSALGIDPQARGGTYGSYRDSRQGQHGDNFDLPYPPNAQGDSGLSRYPTQPQSSYGHTAVANGLEETEDDEYT